ncbi:uncharacterized protein [Rutidosis leptorrhynchoides]|uniref:uncharacterized protein n=1 Tax=Rutidosis leptorrhynchoides TaxID=125765 RepID=UPI003A99917F
MAKEGYFTSSIDRGLNDSGAIRSLTSFKGRWSGNRGGGGSIILWDTNYFEAIDVISIDYAIGTRGKWKNNNHIVNIVNVYGPHDDDKKKIFWQSLGNIVGSRDEAWVLCGDFIEVRDQSERFNCVFSKYRVRWFNDFILSNDLMDIPLGGRIYTRVSDDGTKFSKLERFLVNEKFYRLWDCLAAVVFERTKSDHCPIILKDEEKNFGPKPFKIFDAWFEDEEFENTVKDSWATSNYNGPGLDCKLMVKLKDLKAKLRAWSKVKFEQLDKEIDLHKSIANSLELKVETTILDDNELNLWKNARKHWIEKEKSKASMIEQKARIQWALNGDENSKFFHSIIRNRYNRSSIRGLNIDGVLNEKPHDIKVEVFNHFKRIFEEPGSMRPSMEGLLYPSISTHYNKSVHIGHPNWSYNITL